MKKLLLIAILMLALVLTAVACDKTPAGEDTTVQDTTAETPTEAPTEEPTTEEVTTEEPTEEPTTEEVTTEEPTTEEVTTEEPETEPQVPHYDNYNVPQDQWVMTGHNTQLNDASNGMVAAGGVESAALLHQGSIALGEIDLSKYSKVVVMWGCDNSQVTIDHYNANANNRIMLLNAVMDGVMSPAAETIIAGGTYELKGWAVTAFEIDLTSIDYNGPVWLAIDALPGTFALVASVEFVA